MEKHFGQHTDEALKIIQCESQGRPDAVGDTHLVYKKNGIEYGASYGLFQIRYLPKRDKPSQLLNPEHNIQTAYAIYKDQGWNPWTCKKQLAIK